MKKINRVYLAVVIAAILIGSIVYYYTTIHMVPPPITQVTLAITTETDHLDPQQATWIDFQTSVIFDSLIDIDAEGQAVPALARKFEISPDGKIVTFYLDERAKFHDGTPVTAEDVKFSMERYLRLSPYKEDLADIERVEIVDKYTVKFHFKQSAPYVWVVLGGAYGSIVPKHYVEKVGDAEFMKKPIGSGPFKLVEWVAGSHLLYERHEDYVTNRPFLENKGAAKFDKLKIRIIPEELTRVAEFEKGEVQLLSGVPIPHWKRLKEAGYQIISYQSAGIDYLGFNNQREPFNDIRVRKAIALTIDRTPMVKEILEGAAVPIYGAFSEVIVGYSQEAEDYARTLYTRDLAKAKQLFAEVGWKPGPDGVLVKDGVRFRFPISIVDDPTDKRLAELIQFQLREVGIEITIEMYDHPTLRKKHLEGDFYLTKLGYGWPDADILIFLFDVWPNRLQYKPSPELHDLLWKARNEPDYEKRMDLYLKAQKILSDDCPWVPLYVRTEMYAARGVKNAVKHPFWGGILLTELKP